MPTSSEQGNRTSTMYQCVEVGIIGPVADGDDDGDDDVDEGDGRDEEMK